ncbi:aminotransferase-like domain-containing protein [Capillimicrobium parvum]|uniref:2-aminoadipate transaminase n=1 Tax=Capillimicrobium parvum TaxID=2884022 RepID=A0A9E6XUP4_9ACTN|nr:PLP-dependent aminotransferase family protein [Capillimicrobium parvum]UGS34525.1 2-aminoadipate transaminase [Capillimicrobium parvum]
MSVISFGRGMPSVDIVDMDALEAAAHRAFRRDRAGIAGYGPPAGHPPLRSWIAERHGVDLERVFISNGSMQAMSFLFDHVLRPGDAALVESPTFDLTLRALRRRGADVHGIAVDADGLNVDAVAAALDAGVPARLLHVVPNFQNPTGTTLPPERRRALVELLSDRGVLLLEDDPYADLRFAGTPLAPMLGTAAPDEIVYSSSFSKIVCPGVRVGYLIAPPPVVSALEEASLETYLSANTLSQAVVYELCAGGALDAAIAKAVAGLAERARTLVTALRRELPDARFTVPEGGYFVWLELAPDTDAVALSQELEADQVTVMPGTCFTVSGGRHALRLSYASVTPPEIDEGIARLAAVYRAHRGSVDGTASAATMPAAAGASHDRQGA